MALLLQVIFWPILFNIYFLLKKKKKKSALLSIKWMPTYFYLFSDNLIICILEVRTAFACLLGNLISTDARKRAGARFIWVL